MFHTEERTRVNTDIPVLFLFVGRVMCVCGFFSSRDRPIRRGGRGEEEKSQWVGSFGGAGVGHPRRPAQNITILVVACISRMVAAKDDGGVLLGTLWLYFAGRPPLLRFGSHPDLFFSPRMVEGFLPSPYTIIPADPRNYTAPAFDRMYLDHCTRRPQQCFVLLPAVRRDSLSVGL